LDRSGDAAWHKEVCNIAEYIGISRNKERDELRIVVKKFHLGDRLAVDERDEDLGWPQVAVDDALLMRVLHRLVDRQSP
jgi:hypothetical protein